MRNKPKRILSIFIAILLALSVIPAAANTEQEYPAQLPAEIGNTSEDSDGGELLEIDELVSASDTEGGHEEESGMDEDEIKFEVKPLLSEEAAELTYMPGSSGAFPTGFYANGRTLVFTDGATEGYTNVYYADEYAGGGEPIDLATLYPEITGSRENGFNLDTGFTFFFLGSCAEDCAANTEATIEGGKLSYIFGGGMSAAAGESANVTGNTRITVNGGTINRIHGGGRGAGAGAQADVYGNTQITINNAASISMIVGGGYVNTGNGSATIHGNTNITVNDGKITTIYGGGYAGGVSSTSAVVNTGISIDGGTLTTIYGGGYAYGASSNAAVGASSIIISGFTPSGTCYIHGGGNAYGGNAKSNVTNANIKIMNSVYTTVSFSIYGGGYAATNTGANADVENSTITYAGEQRSPSDSLQVSIYGGGRAGTNYSSKVANSVIHFSGAAASVYGGGYSAGSAVTGSSKVYVTGGTISSSLSLNNNNTSPAENRELYVSGGMLGVLYPSYLTGYTCKVSPEDDSPVYLTELTLSNNGNKLPLLDPVVSLDIEDAEGGPLEYGTDKMYVRTSTISPYITTLLLMLPEGAKVKGANVNGIYYQATSDIIVTDDTTNGMLFYGTAVPVTNISGVPSEAVADLNLADGEFATTGRVLIGGNPSITVTPTGATFKSISWSLNSFSGSQGSAWLRNGYLFANWSGTASITATIKNGGASGDYTQNFNVVFSLPQLDKPVEGITGVISEAEVDTQTVLTGSVSPSNATNKTITWSVKDAGGTGAEIDGALFTASSPGTAVVTATVKDGTDWGTDFTHDFEVLVTAKKITIADGDTEVSVKAAVEQGDSRLLVEAVDKGDLPDDLKVPADHDFVAAYKVMLENGEFGAGTVSVTLPVDSALNGRSVTIDHAPGVAGATGFLRVLRSFFVSLGIRQTNVREYSGTVIAGKVTIEVTLDSPKQSLGQFSVRAMQLTDVNVPNASGKTSLRVPIVNAKQSLVLTLTADHTEELVDFIRFTGTNDSLEIVIKGDSAARRTLTFTGSTGGNPVFKLPGDSLVFKDLDIILKCSASSFISLTSGNSSVTFDNCTITIDGGGISDDLIKASGQGGAVTLTDSFFPGLATGHVLSASRTGPVTIRNCEFSNGGKSALYLVSVIASIFGSKFENFTALNSNDGSVTDFRYGGGGICAFDMTSLEIENSSFKDCTAVQPDDSTPTYGGAIFIGGSSNTLIPKVLSNVTIENCKASTLPVKYWGAVQTGADTAPQILKELGGGGGLCVYGGQQVIMYGGEISGCEVNLTNGMGGGAAVLEGSSLTVRSTEISGNNAARGGGIASFHSGNMLSKYSQLEIYDAKIHGNSALNQGNNDCMGGGGGVFAGLHSSLTINGITEIYSNKARRGGGVSAESKPINEERTKLTINGAHIYGNEAELYPANSGLGGGVYVDSYITAVFAPTVVRGNTATSVGGGIWLCSHGNVNIQPVDGTASYQNNAYFGGDDIHTEATGGDSVPRLRGNVTISPVALGFGYSNWYKDENGGRDSGPADTGYYTARDMSGTGVISLKSHLSAAGIQKAAGLASVIIENNTAVAGGGIAINGDIDFGRPGVILASATLIKKDKDTKEPLKGAAFQLYDNTGSPAGLEQSTDENGKITVDGLIHGAQYYFVETKAPYGYKMEAPGTQHIFTADYTTVTEIEVENEKLDGSLTISKTISGTDIEGNAYAQYDPAGDTKKFDFTVWIGDPAKDAGKTYKYHLNGGAELDFTNGGKISLGNGENAVFTGIPVGTYYSVEEDNYFELGNDSYLSFGDNAHGVIKTGGSAASFTNFFVPSNKFKAELSSLVVVERILAHPDDIDYDKYFKVTIVIGDDPSETFVYQVIEVDDENNQGGVNAKLDYYDANDPGPPAPIAALSARAVGTLFNLTPSRPASSTEHDKLQNVPEHKSNSNEIVVHLNHNASVIIYDIEVGTNYTITQEDYTNSDGYMIDSTVKTSGVILPDKDILPDIDTNDSHLLRVRADLFNYFVQPVMYTFEIKKEWLNGSNTNPPAYTEIRLVNQTTGSFDSRTLTAMSSWESSFTAKKYDDAGNVINYVLQEVPVNGYTPAYKDVTPQQSKPNESWWQITNTYNDTSWLPAPGAIPPPGGTPAPGTILSPENTPAPGDTPVPGDTSAPGDTPVPGDTSAPGDTPAPGDTSAPGDTPAPGDTSSPEYTPTPGGGDGGVPKTSDSGSPELWTLLSLLSLVGFVCSVKWMNKPQKE